MSDWTEGYVADIGYTFGYYAELNPQRVKLAFLNAGYAFPATGAACELGFGQGISVNVHAAASVTRWYGTDFNPAQAGFAQELAQGCDSGAQLYDEAFDAFCNRADLPEFDYIGLHGIWSWISDENRAVITDFIRRKLKVGGVLYISYNTQPGWAAMAPLRDLLTEHAELMGAPGLGIVPRIDGSLDFAQKVLATDAAYARANPGVPKRLEQLKGQDRNYLAHEYFNRDWLPMSFSRMKGWLEDAKLSYVCSAHYLDHIDIINLNSEQQKLINEIPDRMFRETVRDFLVNQQFRRDYWVRGARQLPMLDRLEMIRQQRLVMVVTRGDVSLKASGALGEASLQEDIYGPVLDLMSDYKVRTIGEIEHALRERQLTFAQLMQIVVILVGKSALHGAQEDADIKVAAKRTAKLNRELCLRARALSANIALASPVTGGAVAVSRIEQLFILAIERKMASPVEWARMVLGLLMEQGQRVVKAGVTLEDNAAQMEELVSQATVFKERRLPLLQALRVC